MSRSSLARAGAAFLAAALAASAARAASITDFANFSLTSGSSVLLPGRLYVPPEAAGDPSTPRPLVLFLHGAGESGTNNAAQVNGNIDNLLAEAKRRGAFLYAPQTNGGWSSATILDRVATMLDRALAEQPVNPTRIYVTGLSMGGGGAWNMLARFEDRFAAAVPICAVSPNASFAPGAMNDMPIWAFHARDDNVVPYTSTRNVIAGILAASGETLPSYPARPTGDFSYLSPTLDLRHTEYRTGGHGIWGRVYNTPEVYEWMFAHSLIPEPAGAMIAATGAVMGLSCVRRGRSLVWGESAATRQ